jgi:DNA repair photolyase
MSLIEQKACYPLSQERETKDIQENTRESATLHLIYSPEGVEFARLAFNPWIGCKQRCTYCRVPTQFHKNDEDFLDPRQEKDMFQKLEEDLKLIAGGRNLSVKKGKGWIDIVRPVSPVLLMIAGDLYSPPNADLSISRKIIELFNKYKVPFNILTIGGTKAAPDFDLYFEGCLYGCTLTFDNEIDSLLIEPGAALPTDRIDALKQAYNYDIQTWVLLEPVINPDQTLKLIELTHPFVSEYLVGMTIHGAFVSEYWADKKSPYVELEKLIDWHKFRAEAEALLQKLGCRYKIGLELANATWG